MQAMKSELDALVWSSAAPSVVRLYFAEVHGGARDLLSASAAPGQQKSKARTGTAIPANDQRLGSLSQLSAVAFELQSYADFPKRSWLRAALDQTTIWKGGRIGVERVSVAELPAVELQNFLGSAILAVADAEDAPALRAGEVLQRDLRDLLRAATDALKARAKAEGWPRGPIHRGKEFSRREFGLGRNNEGACVGDPPRPLAEERVRNGIEEAVKRKLLRSNEKKTSQRKYEVTDLGWELAHGTVQVQQACLLLRSSPLRIRLVQGRLELTADSGARVVFEPVS